MAAHRPVSAARAHLAGRLPVAVLLVLGVLGIGAFAGRVLQASRLPDLVIAAPPAALVPTVAEVAPPSPAPAPLAGAATPSADQLQFEDAPVSPRDDGGFLLQGTVRNLHPDQVFEFEDAQPLLLRLFDAQGQTIVSYVVPLRPPRLPPGATARWEQIVPPDVAARAARIQRVAGAGYWSPAVPPGGPAARR